MLPVVDELLGLEWTDDQQTMERSMRQLEDSMQVRGDEDNPWVYANLRCENQRPWVETEGIGRARITWQFEDTGVDGRVVQTIWNTLTGGQRMLLPRPNRRVSPYLLYASGDRERITIQDRESPERKMCFTRVHPLGAVGSALLLERLVAAMDGF
jgi:hypothetical protein